MQKSRGKDDENSLEIQGEGVIKRQKSIPYIIYSKFSKSRARNLQTFQSGAL